MRKLFSLLFSQFLGNPKSTALGFAIGLVLFNWDGKVGSFSEENELVKDPIGATYQIQQKIKMDEEEQRLIQAQMARFRAGPIGAPQARQGPQVRRPPQQPQCKYRISRMLLV